MKQLAIYLKQFQTILTEIKKDVEEIKRSN